MKLPTAELWGITIKIKIRDMRGDMRNKTKKERIKEVIKTPLWATISVTIVILIILIALNKILMTETIDVSIIFIALLPFLIYLVISGKISEIGGGGFAIKFHKASEAKVIFKKEVPYSDEEEAIVKWSLEYLKNDILPEFAENLRSTLKIKKEYIGGYQYKDLKEYLEQLTKFDFFRYVLFVDENDVFNSYMLARTLLAQLISAEQGNWIIDSINGWNLDEISGCKKDYVFNYWSSKEVLRIMEERGITDIAVVDKDMKFKGFTNRELIIASIVNNLIIKAE